MVKRRTKKNYVNNPDFYDAIVAWKEEIRKAEELGEERPRVTNYLGECITQIATNLAKRPNFSGYSYKDDMVADAILNCIKNLDKFNPEKTQNPFAYFTQACWFTFLQRIKTEKKQMYIRFKQSQSMKAYDDNGEVDLNSSISPQYMNDFIEDFEQKNINK